MTDDLNLIKNPSFLDGVRAPTGWQPMGDVEAVRWSRESVDDGSAEPVLTLRCDDAQAVGGLARRVRCAGDEHYRIEILVSCDCQPDDDASGFILTLQPLQAGEPADDAVELLAPAKLNAPTRLRAYFHSPQDIRSVEVQVGLARTRGLARIHEILMVSILEPEAQSHVLACPPPAYAYPAPKKVRTVNVLAAPDRPIVDVLRRRFGRQNVKSVSPSKTSSADFRADALLFLDALPKAAATLKAVEKLAADRIVILSLPTFAKIAGKACDVRTVEQLDDPIHADVHFANFITRGFALDDVFPYAWRGADPRAFVQRHFRRSPALRQFCQRHEFETILRSVCNADATSERPVCLFKATPGGAIVVLDVDPVEAEPTNFNEPDLALFLLLNVLGADQTTLGQYVSPANSDRKFRDEVAELGQRFPALRVGGQANPDLPRVDQFVELGASEASFGLPRPPRPLILIRSGLRGDDLDGIYGTMLWLKNLVRPYPYTCPYALELISRFRLTWVPLCAQYHRDNGWHLPDDNPQLEMGLEVEADSLGALIDVTHAATQQVRLIVSDQDLRRRMAAQLPDLVDRLLNKRFFGRAAQDWQFQQIAPQILADTQGAFHTDLHRRALASGATLIRIEFPGPAPYLTTDSIRRTDLVAQILELTVGMLYGWIATNRQLGVMKIAAPSLNNGHVAQLLTINDTGPVATPTTVKSGQTLSIPPASAICIAT